MYEGSFMSVKRAWNWSTFATRFPHCPEIAVRVAGVRPQLTFLFIVSHECRRVVGKGFMIRNCGGNFGRFLVVAKNRW